MGAETARRPLLSVRAALVLIVSGAVLVAVAVSLFSVAVLGPTAERLGRDGEAIVDRLSTVVDKAAATERTLEALRSSLAEGVPLAGSVSDLLDRQAERSEAVGAAVRLQGVPGEMRVALAAAADTESQLMAKLREVALYLRAGEIDEARDGIGEADSLHAVFARQLGAAQTTGLVDLAAKQQRLVELSGTLQRFAPLGVLLALLLAAATVLTLQVRVGRPLGRLDRALRAVAAGDLDATLPDPPADEMGRLYRQFNAAVAILRADADRQRRHAASLRDRLARIVEETADEIYVVDATDLRILETNTRARRNLGYAADELADLTPRDLLAGPDIDLEAEVFAPLRRGVREQVVLAGHHRRKDGGTYPVELRIRYGADQEPPAFLVLGLDKSEAVQREEMLRQAQKMEAVGQLTGGVAHDFNNLLTVIQGNLELLVEGLDGDAAGLAAAALDSTRRGAALTRHLLAFARRQPLEPEGVDLNRLVADMSDMLRRTLGEGLDVQTVLAGGLWPCEADPRQLENVVLNLALNARDAMKGQGTLTIETANVRLDDDYAAAHAEVVPGQYVMLALSDRGPGMPPEILSRAFEPFFTTKERGRGSGLGLAMVFGFVKQSGGHVKIYSEPGQGTTVKVYLPRWLEAPVPATEPAPVAAASEPRGAGETVLVVEDDPHVRALIARHLATLGYGVLQAADAAAGLEIFAAHAEVALVLTDVILPGELNGREMVARMARQRPEVPAVYMSGYTENAVVHQGRLDPGIRLLQKPFSRAALARKLAEALGA